ncbi:MAG: phosphatase PAP2 family protein [Albidovulum sp.]
MYFVRPFFLLLLLAVYLLCVALTFIQPHQIDYSTQFQLFEFCALLAAACLCLRILARRCEAGGRARMSSAFRGLAGLFELAALVIATSVVLRTMDYLSKATSVPLADGWLSKVGPMLGFNWLTYFEVMRDAPTLQLLMEQAYNHLNSAMLIFLVLLVLSRQHAKVRTFTEAAITCSLVSLVGGALFPAFGAAAFWIPDYADPATWAGYPGMPGVYAVEELKAVRQLEAPMLVGSEKLMGLVTFPSLHTALGMLMILVARRTWVCWPALAYGFIMIAATPIWGGHYLADLISGAALAVVAVLVIERFPPRRRRPEGHRSPELVILQP